MSLKEELTDIYNHLYIHNGHCEWWPGDSKFEICIGAILTQNVSWRSTEKAIIALKENGYFESPEKFYSSEPKDYAQLMRASRYYNQKAQRIKDFTRLIFDKYDGDVKKMLHSEMYELRRNLLKIKGIGKETADCILLYGAEKPIFVIDAYTKRLFTRFGYFTEKWKYDKMQQFFMDNTERNADLYNDYHAQIVIHGQSICKTKPSCSICPISKKCTFFYHKSLARFMNK